VGGVGGLESLGKISKNLFSALSGGGEDRIFILRFSAEKSALRAVAKLRFELN
jgi:hypothetical protein